MDWSHLAQEMSTKTRYWRNMDWSHLAQEMSTKTRYWRNDRREEKATTKK